MWGFYIVMWTDYMNWTDFGEDVSETTGQRSKQSRLKKKNMEIFS